MLSAKSQPELPTLRGRLHVWAFYLAIPTGIVVGLLADGGKAHVAAAIYGGTVVTMFGASALYHRILWRPRIRPWIRRLDHAMIFTLIAGTYTPFGLIVLHGAWRISILAIVWGGATVAIVVKLFWVDAPKWVAAVIGLALGWAGVAILPQLATRLDPAAVALLGAGGVAYTAGAITYAWRRPNPVPAVFGYHELFHALTIVGVACQYVAIAFFIVHAG